MEFEPAQPPTAVDEAREKQLSNQTPSQPFEFPSCKMSFREMEGGKKIKRGKLAKIQEAGGKGRKLERYGEEKEKESNDSHGRNEGGMAEKVPGCVRTCFLRYPLTR